jgi:hypothetical protein
LDATGDAVTRFDAAEAALVPKPLMAVAVNAPMAQTTQMAFGEDGRVDLVADLRTRNSAEAGIGWNDDSTAHIVGARGRRARGAPARPAFRLTIFWRPGAALGTGRGASCHGLGAAMGIGEGRNVPSGSIGVGRSRVDGP